MCFVEEMMSLPSICFFIASFQRLYGTAFSSKLNCFWVMLSEMSDLLSSGALGEWELVVNVFGLVCFMGNLEGKEFENI